MFILSFDIAEIYKYMLEMYNSVLDLNFFGNTIKPTLYCYGIIQYVNLVQHGLLRATASKYGESHDSSENSDFFFIASKRPFW